MFYLLDEYYQSNGLTDTTGGETTRHRIGPTGHAKKSVIESKRGRS